MPNMGEETHNSEEVNKEKNEEKYTKNIITKNYTTYQHKD
jgi:hypothetical protein